MSRMNCPKCDCPFGQVQHTFHHILPRRFFPGSDLKLSICRACHDMLERRIPVSAKMPRGFYFLVVNNFLEYQAVKDPDLWNIQNISCAVCGIIPGLLQARRRSVGIWTESRHFLKTSDRSSRAIKRHQNQWRRDSLSASAKWASTRSLKTIKANAYNAGLYLQR